PTTPISTSFSRIALRSRQIASRSMAILSAAGQSQKVTTAQALAIEAPRLSDHVRMGAAGLLGKLPMNAVQSVVATLFGKPTGIDLHADTHPVPLDALTPHGLIICEAAPAAESCGMTDQQDDPLAQFGLDAIDLRWTLKDIESKRSLVINKDHL